MEILLDALIALLSCIGIWTLGKMLSCRLFGNWDKTDICFDTQDDSGSWMKEANTWKKQRSKTK